jgi:nicotinamidase-related amidase
VRKNEETPGASQVALLIIDVVTDFEFEDGNKLLVQAMRMAPHLAELKKKVKAANIPVISMIISESGRKILRQR